MGSIPIEMNAKREFPQPLESVSTVPKVLNSGWTYRPSVLYMLGPAIGSRAPSRDLKTVLAANADAACKVNASMRYAKLGVRTSLPIKVRAHTLDGHKNRHDGQAHKTSSLVVKSAQATTFWDGQRTMIGTIH